MSVPSLCRRVKLVDARALDRPFIDAEVYRDYPIAELSHVEELWGNAREVVQATGLSPLEHSHWDWRNKAHSVEAGRHMLVAVECEGEVQGLMAVVRLPRRSTFSDEQIVYIDYLESAPWNLRGVASSPKLMGIGTVLIAESIRLSLEMGLAGRVGLHSLPQAEAFYTRSRMTKLGPDPEYFDLTYFEYTDQQATGWLSLIGVSL